MTKAFDFADLKDRLKAKGLSAAEKVLKTVAGEVIDWAAESLLMGGTISKIASPIVAGLKPTLLAELDKLDGEVGN